VAVDGEAGRARVAFAAGREAVVGFDDVKWARRAGAERRRDVRSIDEVLAVGDVARFRLRPADAAVGRDSFDADSFQTGTRTATQGAVLYQRPLVQGALLSFDVQTGDVLSLVGGYDFEQSEFDRATQAMRQPGSAFKPLIYATALGRGYTPASIVYDRPAVYEDAESGFVWRPENYGRQFLGALTISEALARSVNNATIHLLQDVGVDPVIDLARRLGITAPLERNLGLALGVSPVTLLELTRAYAIFAAGGRRVQPRFVARVLDREGNVLLEDLVLGETTAGPALPGTLPDLAGDGPAGRPQAAGPSPSQPFAHPGSQQLIPPTQAYLTTALLRGVVEHPRGTGRRVRSLGRPLAGKTGTTNDQGDAWFIGFSPEVATGVWVGFDERRVLGRGETGSRAAAPIWIEYMGSALARSSVRDFAVPEGIVFARIDPQSGLLAAAGAEDSLFQPFVEGTEPRETAKESLSAAESRRLRLDF
jgi:penicillin-binding protein 1A